MKKRINSNLTPTEEKYLLSIGYLEEDLPQIAYAKDTVIITNIRTRRTISKERAKQVLGVKGYISGIGRATFHNSSVRCSNKNPNLSYYFIDKTPFGTKIPNNYSNDKDILTKK